MAIAGLNGGSSRAPPVRADNPGNQLYVGNVRPIIYCLRIPHLYDYLSYLIKLAGKTSRTFSVLLVVLSVPILTLAWMAARKVRGLLSLRHRRTL